MSISESYIPGSLSIAVDELPTGSSLVEASAGSIDPRVKPVENLNGLWDFAFLGKVDVEGICPADLETSEKMPVPSAFDALPAYAGKRGAAIYRTRFKVPPGQPARIEFGAVSMWTRIFVDGVSLYENACGYAPFSVDLPPSAVEERQLDVLVDNRFDFERVPMHEEYFDFYQYGGILRAVRLRHLPTDSAFIEAVKVTPTSQYREGEVEIMIELSEGARTGLRLGTRFLEEEEVYVEVPQSGNVVLLKRKLSTPTIWSPETPNLHRLRVRLYDGHGQLVEKTEVRFGLRQIEARSGALWLNGERLQLRGVNRHEWHPNYGPCTPPLQMAADLQMLREIGCNFIRGAHYHQDQQFLDLCDELGFLVWEENLGWGQREKTFRNRKFGGDHAQALRAMVRASWNHPSVIIWGFLNEAGTDHDYARAVLEETVAILATLDPSRLTSYATMFALEDKHYDLVDVISLNLYPGWYHCEDAEKPLELIAPEIRRCFDALDAKGLCEKPVIISEIGAEALYGWRDSHDDFFSEEYQAEYLKAACREALTNPRCSGIALWHWSDVRTYSGGRSLLRPRTFNNKGIVDEYRRPKAAYRAVGDQFRGAISQGSERGELIDMVVQQTQ